LNSCTDGSTDTPTTEHSTTTVSDTNPLIGRWVLISRETSGKPKEVFSEAPAKVELKFENNGYFETFDRLKNTTHRRDFGQWEQTGSQISFQVQRADSTYSDQVTIIRQTENELVLKAKKQQKYITDTYKKK
jgi:hypothetical protein